MSRGSRRGSLLLGAFAAAGAAAAVGAAPASAAVSCAVTGDTLQIELDAPGDSGYLGTADVAIVVDDGVDPVTCTGTLPTVNNIDQIVASDTSSGGTLFTVLAPGAFAPGDEDEPGLSDEIEIRAHMGEGADALYIRSPSSSTNADSWRLARRTTATART